MPETDITDIAGSHGSPLTGVVVAQARRLCSLFGCVWHS